MQSIYTIQPIIQPTHYIIYITQPKPNTKKTTNLSPLPHPNKHTTPRHKPRANPPSPRKMLTENSPPQQRRRHEIRRRIRDRHLGC